MRDDLESAFGSEIYGAREVAEVTGELRLIAEEPADVSIPSGRHRGNGVTMLLDGVDDILPEPGSEAVTGRNSPPAVSAAGLRRRTRIRPHLCPGPGTA